MEMSAQIRVAGLEAIHAFRLHRFAPQFMAGIGTILQPFIMCARRVQTDFSQTGISRSRRHFSMNC